MNAHEAFYEMVKDWTMRDYWTPKIKSEVIIDMLISEFVEDIISYVISEGTSKNIKLISKEFPIPRVGQSKLECQEAVPTKEDTRQYASVDFLMADTKNESSSLYFVELKTTKDSFDGKQLLNMLWACNQGTSSLYYRFFDLIKYHVIDKNGRSSYRQKYKAMLMQIHHSWKGELPEFFDETIMESVREKLGQWKDDISCQVVYLSLHDPELNIDSLLNKGKKDLSKAQRKKLDFQMGEFDIWAKKFIYKKNPVISLQKLNGGFDDFLKARNETKYEQWKLVKEILSELEVKNC